MPAVAVHQHQVAPPAVSVGIFIWRVSRVKRTKHCPRLQGRKTSRRLIGRSTGGGWSLRVKEVQAKVEAVCVYFYIFTYLYEWITVYSEDTVYIHLHYIYTYIFIYTKL